MLCCGSRSKAVAHREIDAICENQGNVCDKVLEPRENARNSLCVHMKHIYFSDQLRSKRRQPTLRLLLTNDRSVQS